MSVETVSQIFQRIFSKEKAYALHRMAYALIAKPYQNLISIWLTDRGNILQFESQKAGCWANLQHLFQYKYDP